MIDIHGVHGSPFVRKVLVALDIKGVPYNQIPQMPFANDAKYMKINPLGKIPTLVDGDLILGDSKVICQYLEEAYPEPPLYPSDVGDRARAHWFEDFAGDRLTEFASGIFFQRFMRPMAFQQEPDEELISKIINRKLPPLLDYLERELPPDGYLFGEFGMADLSLASQFINAGYAGYSIDSERWPLTAAMVERVKAHTTVAKILIDEKAALGFE